MGPVVAARAAVHALGYVGLFSSSRAGPIHGYCGYRPIHALGEALVVLPLGFTLYQGLYIVGFGTLLHHGLDALIAFLVVKAISLNFSLGHLN